MRIPSKPLICAYYYPGWHDCPIRRIGRPRGWSEWDLVYSCPPRFDGQEQPNRPQWGRYDETDPVDFGRRLETARAYSINALIFAFYWSRGKQVMNGALEHGFCGGPAGNFPFAVMWANRMPRRILPIKDPQAALISPHRLVYTDRQDFLSFIAHMAERFFRRPNYLRLNEALYLSIFDTSFFLRQMGLDEAKAAITEARRLIAGLGLGALHLAAIDPIPEFQPHLRTIGFDSVTHYVFLPDWKGPFLQDFTEMAEKRVGQWPDYPKQTGLPYFPAVSPGWDANPRGTEFGTEKPQRYPWSPVIINRSPQRFQQFLESAVAFSRTQGFSPPPVFVSSWNEWSEGHYLEPDERYGLQWLESVLHAAHGS
jgi:hypothetical protein